MSLLSVEYSVIHRPNDYAQEMHQCTAQLQIWGCGVCMFCTSFASSNAFAPSKRTPIRTSLLATRESLQLTNNISPSETASLALAPNHSEKKSGAWIESTQADEKHTRYMIVEGVGSITFTNVNGKTAMTYQFRLFDGENFGS